MSELSEFEHRLAAGLDAVAGPRRAIDAIAIARTAASQAPAQGSILSRFSPLAGEGTRVRGRRPGRVDEGHDVRPLVVLIAVVLIMALAFGALAVGSGLMRLTWVAPSQSEIVSPSVALTQLTEPTMWTGTANPAEIRFGETATLLPDGSVLLVGGNPRFDRRGTSSATAELYDARTGRWTLTGSLHEAREEHAAVLLASGEVLVIGGNAFRAGQDRQLSSAELYNPRTGAWTETGRLKSARSNATATLLPDGKVLVTGGVSSVGNDPEHSAEVYDPATGRWAKAGSMSVGRNGHTATLLPEGRVLVVGGGCCDRSARASAELYDPASGTWAPTGALSSGRVDHAAVLLEGGKVLVYGGDNRGYEDVVTMAEVYDPSTSEWVATGAPDHAANLFESQGSEQASRLPDGKVLAVAQGVTGELYDPSSGTWTAVGRLAGDGYTYVHTSTLLADGRVLVTSEWWPAAGGGPMPVAALFDPDGAP